MVKSVCSTNMRTGSGSQNSGKCQVGMGLSVAIVSQVKDGIPCASWPADMGTSGLIKRPASVTKVEGTCAHCTQTPISFSLVMQI